MPCPPRRPAPARVPCAVLSLPDAGFFLRSAARVPHAAYPCARPRHPHSPIPPCRGFCPSAAGRTDIGREPARTVPAASPCAPPAAGFCPSAAGKADIGSEPARACAPRRPACCGFCAPPVFARRVPCARVRIHCAVLSLPAAGSVCRVALRPPVFSCAPRERRILAGSQRVPCPPRRPARPPASSARPNPARRGFCPPPVFACAPREGWILAGSQRVPCPPPAASPCARPPASPARAPHPLRSPIPACRRLFPSLRRPRSPCGLSLRPPASPVRPIPARRGFCPPPVLPALRGKGGYWKRASACRARRVTLRARPRHPHSPIPPCRGFCPPRRPARAGYCLCPAGRADIGIEPARACAPRRPARASASTVQSYPCLPPVFSFAPPPASARAAYPCARPRPPHSPIPPCRGFCPSAAERVDIGREPARAVPAASPCARPPAFPVRPNPTRRGFCPPRRPARASASTAQSYPCLPPAFSFAPPPAFPVWPIPAPARVPRAAYPCAPRVLPASSFACAPREGRILEVSQRVPCPPRRPARASASTAQSYPCLPPVFSCAPREGWILAGSQRVPCPPRHPARPPASPVRPIPARRGFCPPPVLPALRGKGGYWK